MAFRQKKSGNGYLSVFTEMYLPIWQAIVIPAFGLNGFPYINIETAAQRRAGAIMRLAKL